VKASIAQGWKGLSIKERNAVAQMMQSEAAQRNANTNVREFLEKARNNAFGNEIAAEALQLQKFIQDLPQSMQTTVGAIGNILKFIKIPTVKPKVIKK